MLLYLFLVVVCEFWLVGQGLLFRKREGARERRKMRKRHRKRPKRRRTTRGEGGFAGEENTKKKTMNASKKYGKHLFERSIRE